jgi:hypothetical protein
MKKNIIALVLVVVAIVLVAYTVTKEVKRSRGKFVPKELFEEGVVSQEIVCENCGETTTGVPIKRAQCQRYQMCPKCHQEKARAVVYFMCTNPQCNKALVRGLSDIVEGRKVVRQDPLRCPVCGRQDTITPIELDLSAAQEIAKETGQEFP